MVNARSTIVFAALVLGTSSALAAGPPKPKVVATKTVYQRAQPTACKVGEKTSWPPATQGLKLQLGGVLQTVNQSPTPGQKIVPVIIKPSHRIRRRAPRPTNTPKKPSPTTGAKQTPHPTVIQAGTDGKQTAYVVLPATTTRCFDPKATGANRVLHAKIGNVIQRPGARIILGRDLADNMEQLD